MNTYIFTAIAKGKTVTFTINTGTLLTAEDRANEVLSAQYGEDGYTMVSVKEVY